MKCLPKQIKPLINDRGKTLVKVGNNRLVDNKIMFCFSFFNGSSIIEGDFNNYYASTSDATKAISDFFQTIKNISNYNANQFFSPAIKKQFHYNEFDDNEVIDRIENILSCTHQQIGNYLNTINDTVVAVERYFNERYSPAYIVSETMPTNQQDTDFWFQVTGTIA